MYAIPKPMETQKKDNHDVLHKQQKLSSFSFCIYKRKTQEIIEIDHYQVLAWLEINRSMKKEGD